MPSWSYFLRWPHLIITTQPFRRFEFYLIIHPNPLPLRALIPAISLNCQYCEHGPWPQPAALDPLEAIKWLRRAASRPLGSACPLGNHISHCSHHQCCLWALLLLEPFIYLDKSNLLKPFLGLWPIRQQCSSCHSLKWARHRARYSQGFFTLPLL